MNKYVDVVVIGGGIVGCTTAYVLSRNKFSVGLLERNQLGCGTSANTFSWINATAKSDDENYHRLNALGLQKHREMADMFGDDALGFRRSGALEWTTLSDKARAGEIIERVNVLRGWDYEIITQDAHELRAREPGLKFEDDAIGLFAANDGWLHVPAYIEFMRRQLLKSNVLLNENTQASSVVLDDNGRVSAIKTRDAVYHCANVVLCGGVDTPRILDQLTDSEVFSARFPLRYSPGLLVTTPPTTSRLISSVVYTSDPHDFHVRPAENGGLKLGADDTDGMVAESQSTVNVNKAARVLLGCAQKFLTGFDVLGDTQAETYIERCKLGVGIRPVPADGQSLAGALPGADGVYLLVTHSGVTLAPVLGELMAQTIDRGSVPEVLAPFAPERLIKTA